MRSRYRRCIVSLLLISVFIGANLPLNSYSADDVDSEVVEHKDHGIDNKSKSMISKSAEYTISEITSVENSEYVLIPTGTLPSTPIYRPDDFKPPDIVLSPGNLTVDENDPNTISWDANEPQPNKYDLYRNDVLIIDDANWGGGQIDIDISGTSEGLYNYTIIIYDVSLNFAIDTAWITIVDLDPPVFTQTPQDRTISSVSTGNTLVWNNTDLHPNNYTIFRNSSTVVDNLPWNNAANISHNIDGLAIGTYNFTILVGDQNLNTSSDTVWVEVVLTTGPEFDPPIPSNETIEFIEGYYILNWNATDIQPDTFSIYRNGTVVKTGTWDTPSLITLNISIFELELASYNYTVVVENVGDQQNRHTVWVTVVDTSEPNIDSYTPDFSYNETTTGHTVTWIASDYFPNQFTIYEDGQSVFSYSWTRGDPIVWNVDNLAVGDHNISILFNDLYGNSILNTTIVTVIDPEFPVFTSIPDDLTYANGTTGNTLEWTLTDLHPANYTITKDGSSVQSGVWFSSDPITINVDGLTPGTYNYTIYAQDESNNTVSDWVEVQVGAAPVIVSFPADYVYLEGTTGHSLSWTASDSDPNNYELYNESVLFDSGLWTSGDPISVNIDNLTFGYYNFTLLVNDTQNNIETHTVFVTVTHKPVFDKTQGDLLLVEDDYSGTQLQWNASDTEPPGASDNDRTYEIYSNETGQMELVVSGFTWDNPTNISYSLPVLAKGVYNFTIIVFDSYNYTVSSFAIVTVIDTTPPTITEKSVNFSYNEGETGNQISWNATDKYANRYEIHHNSSLIISNGTWTSLETVVISVDGLELGVYNFTIIFFDDTGNTNSSTVIVTVNDNKNPSLIARSPTNGLISYPEGATGNQLSWTATDNHPGTYEIHNNETGALELITEDPDATGTWDSSVAVVFNVDGLLEGVYNYTIFFYDTSSNVLSVTMLVIVTDVPEIFETPPLGVGSTFTIEEGTGGDLIQWNATDSFPDSYLIFMNTTMGKQQIQSGGWTNSGNITLLNLQDFTRGTLNITIEVSDIHGNTAIDWLILVVIDSTAPGIAQEPIDITITEASTDNKLIWIATDNHNSTFVLYHNSSLTLYNGTWSDNEELVFDIDGLMQGIYNFTVVFFDDSGNFNTSTVIITVIKDDTNPVVIYSTPDFSYEEGEVGNQIIWNATDDYAGQYHIFHNSSLIFANGTWSSNSPVEISVDGLDYGVYNFTIVYSDQSRNNATSTVFVTVLDITSPVFTQVPEIEESYGEIGLSVSVYWKVVDKYPDQYVITRNGTEIRPLTGWSSGTAIPLDITGLSKGTYVFTITVYDQSGNQNTSSFILVVEDITAPIVSSIDYESSYIEGTTGHTIDWTATDNHPAFYQVWVNGTEWEKDNWSSGEDIHIVIDGLVKGYHEVSLRVYDESGGFTPVAFNITVIDMTDPVFAQTTADFVYVEDSGGFIISWNVTDLYPDRYEILLDSVNYVDGTWTSTENITLSVDNLFVGEYNFSIKVYDKSGNFAVDEVIVTVIDTTKPVIQYLSAEEGTVFTNETDVTLYWDAQDRHLSTYSVTRNDATISQLDFRDSTIIPVSLEGLTVGFYNFTISVSDESENIATTSILIRIVEPNITLTAVPDINVVHNVHEGDRETFDFTWKDINGSAVPSAQGTVSIIRLGSNNPIVDFDITSDDDGTFNIDLYYSGLRVGNYTVRITLSKQYYESQIITKAITVIPHELVIDIQKLEDLVRGEPYTISVIVFYANYSTPNSKLSLSAYIPKSGKASGVSLELALSYRSLNGNDQTTGLPSVTTSTSGTANFILGSEITSDIQSINGIYLSFSDSESFWTGSNMGVDNLPTVTTESNQIVQLIADVIIKNAVYIILSILIGGIGLYLLIQYRKRREREYNRIMTDLIGAKQELEAVQSLQAIIIQTASGLPLYEVQLRNIGLDSILIGGLSSAISSFLTELDKDETFGFEILERASLSITSHKLDNSTFIVISRKRIPLIVLDQIKNVHHAIENRFEKELTQGQRGFYELEDDDVFEVFQENNFKIGLTKQLKINRQKINRLTNIKALSRILRQKLQSILDFESETLGPNDSFELEELLHYLRNKGYDLELISRMIVLSYSNEGIVSVVN